MPKTKKIFPHISSSDEGNALVNVILVSEGYEQKKEFLNICHTLINKFKRLPPFNLLIKDGSFIEFHCVYAPNNTNSAANENNYILFDTSVSSDNNINFDYQKFIEFSKDIKFKKNEKETIALKDILTFKHTLESYLLVIVLFKFPHTHLSTNHIFNDPSISLTLTTSTHFEQYIFKQIGLLLGLGDESYHDDSKLQNKYSLNTIKENIPNLITYEDYNNPSLNLHWIESIPLTSSKFSYFRIAEDNEDLPNYFNDAIEFWEGGGGRATNVFRPSNVCIMNGISQVKSSESKGQKVNFCLICENYLRKVIVNHLLQYSNKQDLRLPSPTIRYKI